MAGPYPNDQDNPAAASPVWIAPGGSVNVPTLTISGTPFTAGRSMQFNVTTAGTVTLTVNGASVIYDLPTGTTIVPYAVTEWVAGTAVVSQAYVL